MQIDLSHDVHQKLNPASIGCLVPNDTNDFVSNFANMRLGHDGGTVQSLSAADDRMQYRMQYRMFC